MESEMSERQPVSAADESIAAAVAGLVFIPVLVLAIWVIDWRGSLLAAVGFCVIVPSVLGSIAALVARAVR